MKASEKKRQSDAKAVQRAFSMSKKVYIYSDLVLLPSLFFIFIEFDNFLNFAPRILHFQIQRHSHILRR